MGKSILQVPDTEMQVSDNPGTYLCSNIVSYQTLGNKKTHFMNATEPNLLFYAYYFFEIFLFLESFLLPEIKEKTKQNAQPTDPTWQVRPPAKQVCFFLFCFVLFCFHGFTAMF